jgi:prophage regulatory protein
LKKKIQKSKPLAVVPPDVADRYLSKQEVLAVVGVSYPSLWSWMRDGHFPQARVLGTGAGLRTKIGWLKSEVDAWVASRPARISKSRVKS